MKIRHIFAILAFIIAVFGLFIACEDPNKPDPIPNYAVNFEANGGSPAPQGQIVAQGGKVAQPAAMTRTGFTFGGWYKEEACTNQWIFTIDTVTGDTSLYAKWDTNFYTVDFEANGGNPAPDKQNIAYGNKVITPPPMTNTGYGFGGWYTKAVCINQWDFNMDTVTGSITLYAKWDTNFHTISFEANGGNPAPEMQSIAYGGRVVTPPTINKTGYTLDGWYKEAALTNQWDFNINIVSGNVTLYAKWLTNFTVNFDANGGIPSPAPQIIADGGKLSKPMNIYKEGVYLEGWYTEAALINKWDFDLDTVIGNNTLYARWENFYVPGETLAAKLQWLSSNAESNMSYYLEVTATNENLFPHTLSYSGRNNITIRLNGIGVGKIIALLGNGSLFTIGDGVILVLDENIILSGNPSYTNNAPLVKINSGGELIINEGVGITNNRESGVSVTGNGTFTMNGGKISSSVYYNVSGVTVSNNGIFTMHGGEISSSSSYGVTGVSVSDFGTFNMYDGKISGNRDGGVRVSNDGTFTMHGGEISGNNANSGSAVSVYGGTFTMNGGEISSNFRGGVSVSGTSQYDKATFTMSGGKISGNKSTFADGVSVLRYGDFAMSGGEISDNGKSGVSLSTGGIFIMHDGIISGNNVTSSSGGVSVSGGTFTMYDGKISNNRATSGGGVSVSNGSFTMHGGEIYGNTASDNGGGVFISPDNNGSSGEGYFFMQGGEIYGNTAGGVVIYNGTTGDYFTSTGYGGGVYGDARSTWGSHYFKFEKTGGTITSYSNNAEIGNVVKDSSGVAQSNGHAVYINHNNNSSNIKRKETTAGPQDDLSYSPGSSFTWSGEWDY